MTPERLQEIRDENTKRLDGTQESSPGFVDQTIKDLLDYIDQARADAWDEGYWQGAEAERYETDLGTTKNPYRKDTK